MLFVGSVDMDGVHVDQRLGGIATETVNIPFDALVEDIVVPRRVSGFTTKNGGDGRVE